MTRTEKIYSTYEQIYGNVERRKYEPNDRYFYYYNSLKEKIGEYIFRDFLSNYELITDRELQRKGCDAKHKETNEYVDFKFSFGDYRHHNKDNKYLIRFEYGTSNYNYKNGGWIGQDKINEKIIYFDLSKFMESDDPLNESYPIYIIDTFKLKQNYYNNTLNIYNVDGIANTPLGIKEVGSDIAFLDINELIACNIAKKIIRRKRT